MITSPFSVLPLTKVMIKTLDSLGYKSMTPIQALALPHILNNHDVIAEAKTGSGKTATFGIGLISKLDMNKRVAQVLVLCPTRELASQVSLEIRRLAHFIPNVHVLTLCGGKPSKMQIEALSKGVHIVVGTPGRVLYHLEKETLNLEHLHTLVLDEADRMLDMGFQEEITNIIKEAPKTRQTLMFSATYADNIRKLSQRFQQSPKDIKVAPTENISDIVQRFYKINNNERNSTLLRLLNHNNPESTIVFCNTKIQCKEVVDFLKKEKLQVLGMHGDLDQRHREQALIQFANKSCSILVATDVAARGIDIEKIDAIINYEIASTPEVHVHRIGRTGRAGNKGLALSIYTQYDAHKVDAIENYQKLSVTREDISVLESLTTINLKAPMRTLCIAGGKKQKIRPADILGALTGEGGLQGSDVGKIHIGDFYSYVGINRRLAEETCYKLMNGKIKGRNIKVTLM